MLTIKKYSNRRLYDTDASHYITLEELADRVREGNDVRVVDAKSSEDLTQPTLAQVVLESRGAAKLLPVPLLTQLIRMGDDALAELFSSYMSWALEVYWASKRGMKGAQQHTPFAAMGIRPPGPLGQMLGGGRVPPEPPVPRAEDRDRDDDVAEMRRELDELKELLREQTKKK